MPKLGVREQIELEADILGGESSVSTLAERHEISERTVVNYRMRLAASGYVLRSQTPDGEPLTARIAAASTPRVRRQLAPVR